MGDRVRLPGKWHDNHIGIRMIWHPGLRRRGTQHGLKGFRL